MERIYFAYVYSIISICKQIETLTIPLLTFPSLEREMRFTTFDVQFMNKSAATLLESTFKQFNNKQALFLRFVIRDEVAQFHAKASVLRCKDHYVDCQNVISYDMSDICSKLGLLTYFLKDSPQAIKHCPVSGEFAYVNMTMDAEKFGSTFALPGEKWWESYWRMIALFYDGQNTLYATLKLDCYFIEFRSRNRKPII
ncbi:Hypothetical protein CINCED_3A016599 [Cinara cedri]|uniref:Uncharacterized protein n=1 Tax=Cinara cedri TaxID=506608 RepID=A0A5E4N7G7_9HEMI|nr:Hypothetical protein CINCED_3A016599 [Cinara cedri]